MVVAVLALALVVVVVIALVSRVVVYLVVLVDKPRPDHFQVSQTKLLQLAVGRCSHRNQRYEYRIPSLPLKLYMVLTFTIFLSR